MHVVASAAVSGYPASLAEELKSESESAGPSCFIRYEKATKRSMRLAFQAAATHAAVISARQHSCSTFSDETPTDSTCANGNTSDTHARTMRTSSTEKSDSQAMPWWMLLRRLPVRMSSRIFSKIDATFVGSKPSTTGRLKVPRESVGVLRISLCSAARMLLISNRFVGCFLTRASAMRSTAKWSTCRSRSSPSALPFASPRM
mmetsp:Transcript_26407/g.81598  ORF Transcript_26407/g.81598 Transcript_26407/m.81598 type:complete len:203 (-) Transcript_26407:364-972(-)